MTRNNVRKVLGQTAQLAHNICGKQNLLHSFPVVGTTKSSSTNNNYSTKAKKENFINIPKQLHNNNKLMNILVPNFKNYSSSSVSSNNNNIIQVLNPVQYKTWSQDEVCSLLCSPEENGGAGLTIGKVKPLYEAGFDGTSLANIVTNIQEEGKKEAREQLQRQFTDAGIVLTVQLADTLQTVVNWVDNLLKTRLYHLWSEEQVQNNLCKPVDEGGAGLSDFKGTKLTQSFLQKLSIDDNLKIDKIYSSDKEWNIKISNYLQKLIITIPNPEKTFDNKLIGELSEEWIAKINQFQLDNKDRTHFAKDTYEEVEYFYEKARKLLSVWRNIEFPDLTQQLLGSVNIPEVALKMGKPNFDSKYFSQNLPLMGKQDESIAKFMLSFITRFQKSFAGDEQLKKIAKQSEDKRHCCFLLGSSGVGKTRLMCKVPGLYFSCTRKDESIEDKVADELMREAFTFLYSKTLIELYGSVHQVIQMVFISRLIYILKLIQNALENENVFAEFGGILPYLAFMQANGKSKESIPAFKQLVSYQYCDVKHLRDYTKKLVEQITALLNNNSDYFKMEKTNSFIIAIDEANVYTSNPNSGSTFSKLLSPGGNQRSLISIFAQEATLINNFSLSMYAGTNFTADMGYIVQSSTLKTEAKIDIKYFFDFGNVLPSEVIPFLKLHINIPNEEENILNKELLQYRSLRRRSLTYTLENLKHVNNIVESLKMSVEKAVTEQKYSDYYDAYMKYENSHHGVAIQNQIREALVNYITHYHFSCLGSSFTIQNDACASFLLLSNIDSPTVRSNSDASLTDKTWTFKAADYIGVNIAMKLYAKICGITDADKAILPLVVKEKIKMLMSYGTTNIELEQIVRLMFWNLDGKFMNEIPIFTQLLISKENLNSHQFKCKHLLTPADYLVYCLQYEYITKDQAEQYAEFPSKLYWEHYLQKSKAIDGVMLCFPNEQHTDGFLVNFFEDKIINFSFQVKAHTGIWDARDGIASTIFELFYLDNYKDLKLEQYTHLEKYKLESKDFNAKQKTEKRLILTPKDGTVLKECIPKNGMKVNFNSKWWAPLRDDILEFNKKNVETDIKLVIKLHRTGTFEKLKPETKLDDSFILIDLPTFNELCTDEEQRNIEGFLNRIQTTESTNNKSNKF